MIQPARSIVQVKEAIENVGQTILSSMDYCFSAKDTKSIIEVVVVGCTNINRISIVRK